MGTRFKEAMSRSFLPAFLCFCLICGIFCGLSGIAVYADADEYVGMIDGTAWCFLGQRVPLEPSTQYLFSYEFSDELGRYPEAYARKESKDGLVIENITSASSCKTTAIRFTTPASGDTRVDWDQSGKCLIWVGLANDREVSGVKYYRNFLLFRADDTKQSNLIVDADFKSGGNTLDGSIWTNPYGEACGTGVGKTTSAAAGGEKIFFPEEKVGKIESIKWCQLGQWIWLDAETEYQFSYEYSDDLGRYITVCGNNEDGSMIPRQSVTVASVYKTSALKFTTPAVGTAGLTWENGKCQVWVGVKNDQEVSKVKYYRNFCLYATADSLKINLISDGKFFQGPEFYHTPWQNPYHSSCGQGVTKTTLKAAGGDSIFLSAENEYVGAIRNTDWSFLGQRIPLEPNTAYLFSYEYSDDLGRYPEVYGKKESKTDLKIESVTMSLPNKTTAIRFVTPENGNENFDWTTDGQCLIWVGIANDREVSGAKYYRNFRLYKEDDAAQTNLIKDENFLSGNGALDGNIWQNPYGDACGSVVTKCLLSEAGGKSIFANPSYIVPKVDYIIKMDGIKWVQFGQRIALKPATKYVFQYTHQKNQAGYVMVSKRGETKISLAKIIVPSDYYTSGYSFTTPETGDTAVDWDSDGNCLVYVGVDNDRAIQNTKYYADFVLYEMSDPEKKNLLADADLNSNGAELDPFVWENPYGSRDTTGSIKKVTRESAGGMDIFKRETPLNINPKMMLYTRTSRGPNQEPYGCFTIAFPDTVRHPGENYILEFDARATKGTALNEFRSYSIDPELQTTEDHNIVPTINGMHYTFRMREKLNPAATEKFSLMIFVPQNSEGYLSNLRLYYADGNFQKTTGINLLAGKFDDFSHYESVGITADIYTKQGACIGTETGTLVEMPAHYFDPGIDVMIPSGKKMMNYSTKWGQGRITINLPYTVQKGQYDGKQYQVSVYIRPTVDRDPQTFYSAGINGDLIQVNPIEVDGYRYIFSLTEYYDFRLAMDFPKGCQGFISGLEMYETDDEGNIHGENLATAFGAGGMFENITVQNGNVWDNIAFSGGASNTFIDTRAYEKELTESIAGNYDCSGGLFLIPTGFFTSNDNTAWAERYMNSNTENGCGSVAGQIVDGNGRKASNITVYLTFLEDPAIEYRAVSDKNGEFEYESIPVGGYEISIADASGERIVGEDLVWVEEEGDIVTVNLSYDGTLSVKQWRFPVTGDNSRRVLLLTISCLFASICMSVLLIRVLQKSRFPKQQIREGE